MAEPSPQRPRSRQAAKRATRDALLRAGIAEFAARGLAEPSLDDICRRAGFTRGAFYVHFRDREDFISAVMEHVLGRFLDGVIASDGGESDLRVTVGRFIGAIAFAHAGRPPGDAADEARAGLQFHRVLEACARSPEIRRRYVGVLGEAIERVAVAAQRGQAAGAVRRDVDPHQLASILVALALGAVNAVELGVAFDAPAASQTVLALLRAGEPH
jgi:TetR/AcrR family transcriptional repressor of nem operon